MRYALTLAALSLVACGDVQRNTSELSPAGQSAYEVMAKLSDDAMLGRQAGTEGAELAKTYLLDRLTMIEGAIVSEEAFTFGEENRSATNIIADFDANEAGPLLVVTAHYDHLGRGTGDIYNGADDNASGVGAAISIAEHFVQNPPSNDVRIVLLDAEERGLAGARHHVDADATYTQRPVLNLNLDMVSQNADGEIFASGTSHNPKIRPLIEALNTPDVTIRFGHDTPDLGPNDWTLMSDHAAFHEASHPYVYFGVEDHANYHKPSDELETISPKQYAAFVDALVQVAETLDNNLTQLTD